MRNKNAQVKIRKFMEKDAEAVYEIIKRNDLEVSSIFYPRKVITLWAKELSPESVLKKSQKRICLVAEINKIIVGYISLKRNEIKKLFVNPDFHKKGIGKRLVYEIEKTAKRIGLKKLVVESSIYAEPFYKAGGFRKVKEKLKKLGKINFKVIFMEKTLK